MSFEVGGGVEMEQRENSMVTVFKSTWENLWSRTSVFMCPQTVLNSIMIKVIDSNQGRNHMSM